MKKTHRAVLSILLVLALLATLPLTAMAENIGEEGQDPSTTVVQENNKEIENNYGTVEVNRPIATYAPELTVTSQATITNNHGVVGSNKMDKNTDTVPGTITNNYGTVNENRATIMNNGKPQDDGTKFNPTSGTVEHNNLYDAYIDNNYGTVKLNGNSSGSPTINNNYGLVEENKGAKVITNQAGGTIQSNSGLVGKKNEDGYLITDDTSGNYGIVTNNNAGGKVCNREGGEVTNNNDGGRVENYGGTVKNNNAGGTVFNYSGTVTNNNAGGTVQYNEAGSTVKYNHGSVGTDNAQGPNGNNGKVDYNYIDGVVYNNASGIVTTNFGTVHQKSEETSGDNVNSTTTTTYYGLSYGSDTEHLTQINGMVKAGTPMNLDEAAAEVTANSSPRDGYKLTYTWQTSDGNKVMNTAAYTMDAPTWLKLTWEKITSIFKPAASTASSSGSGGGAEAVELSAGKRYIGLGSVIFINEKGYKVVEIKDDAYVVVSFDALPDEDVADLDALYAKLFTPEQQKLIKNVGQLLDSEDVLAVFGTPGNHPVYEISKSLAE